MIGGVKARAFEDNAHWLIQLAQSVLPALRTASERFVTEMLSAIELHAAVVTPIGVQGHVVPPNNGRLYRFAGRMPRWASSRIFRRSLELRRRTPCPPESATKGLLPIPA